MSFEKLLDKIRQLFEKESIYYVGGAQTLPPPLEQEEEDQALIGLKNGDPKARSLLIEHNLRLVVYIAKKFENTGISVEDLTSIGAIGLIKAVNTYNTDKQIRLATYASRCIENEILMYLRRTAKLKGEVSFDEPLKVDWDGNALLLSDILGTEADIVYKDMDDRDDIKLLRGLINKLNVREKEIIMLRYGIDCEREFTQKEVAQKLQISQSYISRLEKKIIKKLKKEMQKVI
ncbi:MAG: RNA polymerase sporulation sigma factor SigE [Clostridiales bacterium]|nr:RNA polymerase sporulation sigma factor SigE [Clostridiales bacterium]